MLALCGLLTLLLVPTAASAHSEYTTISGSVTEQADGSPVEGVIVDLFAATPYGERGTWIGQTRTDADGSYQFELTAGCVVLTFIAPSGREFTNNSQWLNSAVCVTAGDASTVQNAQLKDNGGGGGGSDPASIGGSVDSTSGDPEANVQVDLFETNADGSRGPWLESARTDSSGNYRFSDLEPGCYTTTFIAPSGREFTNGSRWLNSSTCVASGENSSGNNAKLKSPVTQPATIGGSVSYGDGDPGSGLLVDLFESNSDGSQGPWLDSTRTDSSGNYRFPDLEPGCYEVRVAAPSGFTVTNNSRRICVTAGQVNGGVNFSVTEDAPANGNISIFAWDDADADQVRDSGEGPLSGVTLNLYNTATGALVMSQQTDAAGVSVFDVPAGCYRLEIVAPDGTRIVGDASRTVCVDGGATLDVGIAVTPDRPSLIEVPDIVCWLSVRPLGSVTAAGGTGAHLIEDSMYALIMSAEYEATLDSRYPDIDLNRYHVLDSAGNAIAVVDPSRTTPSAYDAQPVNLWWQTDRSWAAQNDALGWQLFDDTWQNYMHYDATFNGSAADTPVNANNLMDAKSIAFVDGDGDHLSTTIPCRVWTDAMGPYSPVAFDLNGDGVIGVTGQTTARDAVRKAKNFTTTFDYGDGHQRRTEWLSGDGDAFLVDDRDGMAATDMSGKRLFGDDRGRFESGYGKLALLDDNGDGSLTGAELQGLVLWQDNGDAKVQDGEFLSLSSVGIVSIDTGYQMVDDRMVSQALLEGGTPMMTEDVWFAAAPAAKAPAGRRVSTFGPFAM